MIFHIISYCHLLWPRLHVILSPNSLTFNISSTKYSICGRWVHKMLDVQQKSSNTEKQKRRRPCTPTRRRACLLPKILVNHRPSFCCYLKPPSCHINEKSISSIVCLLVCQCFHTFPCCSLFPNIFAAFWLCRASIQ